MKTDLHPEWYPDAHVSCMSCGTTWTTGATVPEIQTEICSNCHPFYTGEQRIVDTEGRVEKFMSRLKRRDDMRAQQEAEKAALTPMDLSVSKLGLSRRAVALLKENNIEVVQDFLDKLAEGEDDLREQLGIGRQALLEIKKSLRDRGYDVPTADAADEEETTEEEAE